MSRPGGATKMVRRIATARWTWLLAALIGSSSARADREVPAGAPAGGSVAAPFDLAQVPSEIPAGGVLPLYGSCSDSPTCARLLGVTVRDQTTGATVPGHVELVRTDFGDAWAYFVPDVPFVEGTSLLVESESMPGWPGAKFAVAVGASTPLSASSVVVDTRFTKQRNVLRSECCPTLLSRFTRPRCLEVAVDTSAVLDVSAVMGELIATQYLFAIEVRDVRSSEPAAVTEFRPMSEGGVVSASAAHDTTAPKYCYSLRAQPLVGGATVDIISDCVDNDLTGLGLTERAPDEIAKWLDTCEKNPADAGVVDNVDEDGASNTRDAGAASDDTDAVAARSGQEQGCRLAAGSSAPASSALWWSLVLLVVRPRKRAV